MASRFALIIGSQCDELPHLPFVDDLAGRLQAALGGGLWQQAADSDWVRSPTTNELKAAIEEAFTAANNAAATLLIAFVGHAVARGAQDFYLMTRDADPNRPNSDNSFHFTQFIRERLTDYTSLDGLVFLVDACQAGEGLAGAATRWADVLAANKGRLELLVASGRGSAYDGCFTRTILDTFQTGLPSRGDALLSIDLLPEVSRCTGQQQYLAYNGATLTSGDPGLWLVPNMARSRDAVTGRPAAGLVDQLTSGVILTASVREELSAIEDSGSARLRLVVGAAGSGKSTLLALFVRPKVAKTLGVADTYVKAAAFLDVTSTLESLAAELAAQLAVTVPQYPHARDAVTARAITGHDLASQGSWDTLVRLPLALCTESGRINIIVDGLDQPEQAVRKPILAAIEFMTSTTPAAELGHVRIIAGVRTGENIDTRNELAHASRIHIAAPRLRELAEAVTSPSHVNVFLPILTESTDRDLSGGWLLARLISEITLSTEGSRTLTDLATLVAARIGASLAGGKDSGRALDTLNVIVAVGHRPVLPIGLLAAAVAGADPQLPLGRIRDIVVSFGALVSRGNPGTDHETLGISHKALAGPVADYLSERGVDLNTAHHAIIGAWESLANRDRGRVDDEATAYWATAAPRHYLATGDSSGALQALRSAETLNAIDNRDRWAAWLPVFKQTAGPDHPDTVDAEAQYAKWTGEAGDPRDARRMFASQVQALKVLRGSQDIQLMAAEEQLADWTGQAGHPDLARDMLEHLVPQRRTLSGDRDYATLQATMDLAFWTGESGNVKAALYLYDRLVPKLEEALGPRDRNTIRARGHYARFLGEDARPRDAKEIATAVLADTELTLGADHNDTLWARNNLAWQTGEVDGATAASDMFAALVQDRERVSGPENHGTLVARRDLAIWTGKAGNAASARDQLATVLAIRTRNFGSGHQDTLYERDCLAEWTGKAGDPQAAVDQYAELLEVHETKFGENNEKTKNIRCKLNQWRLEAAKTSDR